MERNRGDARGKGAVRAMRTIGRRPWGRLLRMTLLGALFCLLCGCDSLQFESVDDLLTPPLINANQEGVYQAIEMTLGSGIQYVYPKEGDSRQAIIFCDLDGDGLEEAMVLHTDALPTAGQGAIRLSVFQQNGLDWSQLGRTIELTGAQSIEYLYLPELTRDGSFSLALDWTLSVGGEPHEAMSIFTFDGFRLERIYEQMAPQDYFGYFFADFQNAGYDDLMLVWRDEMGSHVDLIGWDGRTEAVGHLSTLTLNTSWLVYERMMIGQIDEGRMCLFIDELQEYEPRLYNTEIVGFFPGSGSVPGRLMKIDNVATVRQVGSLEEDAEETPSSASGSVENLPDSYFLTERVDYESTIRPAAFLTQDINGDGIVEIPMALPEMETSGDVDYGTGVWSAVPVAWQQLRWNAADKRFEAETVEYSLYNQMYNYCIQMDPACFESVGFEIGFDHDRATNVWIITVAGGDGYEPFSFRIKRIEKDRSPVDEQPFSEQYVQFGATELYSYYLRDNTGAFDMRSDLGGIRWPEDIRVDLDDFVILP